MFKGFGTSKRFIIKKGDYLATFLFFYLDNDKIKANQKSLFFHNTKVYIF